ncbi:MAG: hypothetical protein IT373_23660 [Polyangiaceae bacterium]|nr:hypothetical protein [Polyangiaceae bacterium]
MDQTFAACDASLTTLIQSDRAAASTWLRSELARRIAACNSMSGTSEVTAKSGPSPRDAAMCLELAMARLGSTWRSTTERSRLYSVATDLGPDVLPVNFDEAQATLRWLCRSRERDDRLLLRRLEAGLERERSVAAAATGRRGEEREVLDERTRSAIGSEACKVVRVFESPPRSMPAWATPAIRLQIVRTKIAQADGQTGLHLVDLLIAALDILQGPPAGDEGDSDRIERRRLLDRVRERLAASADEAIEPLVTRFEQQAPGPLSSEQVLAELHSYWQRVSVASSALRSRFIAAASRHLDAVVDDAIRSQRFDHLLPRLDPSIGGDLAQLFSAGSRRLREAAYSLHRDTALRQMAAGRHAAAWLHARIAGWYDRPIAVPEAQQFVERLQATSVVVLRDDSHACPWANPPSPAPPTPSPQAIVVAVQWSICQSAEVRWTVREKYTERVLTSPGRPAVTRSARGSQSTSFGCGPRGTDGCIVTGDVDVVVDPGSAPTYADVQREREVEHRRLETRAEAVFTAVVDGVDVRIPFVVGPETLAEGEYIPPTRGNGFALPALDIQREHVARAFRDALGRGGRVASGISQARAARLVQQAEAIVSTEPDAAEELFVRSLLLGGDVQRASAFLEQRYGLSATTLRQLLRGGSAEHAVSSSTSGPEAVEGELD